MGHAMLTWKSTAVIVGYIGFAYYIYSGHTGPWTVKFDMPRQQKEQFKDIPEFAALFRPDTHPALKKNQETDW